MPKIITVELKESTVMKNDAGEYIHGYSSVETYPAMITNYALKRGRDLGITKGALLTDLFKLQNIANTNKKNNNFDTDFIDADEILKDDVNADNLDTISPEKITPIIYIGLIGANPGFQYSFDEFLMRYHEPLENMMMQYSQLLESLFSEPSSSFADGYKKATDTSPKH